MHMCDAITATHNLPLASSFGKAAPLTPRAARWCGSNIGQCYNKSDCTDQLYSIPIKLRGKIVPPACHAHAVAPVTVTTTAVSPYALLCSHMCAPGSVRCVVCVFWTWCCGGVVHLVQFDVSCVPFGRGVVVVSCRGVVWMGFRLWLALLSLSHVHAPSSVLWLALLSLSHVHAPSCVQRYLLTELIFEDGKVNPNMSGYRAVPCPCTHTLVHCLNSLAPPTLVHCGLQYGLHYSPKYTVQQNRSEHNTSDIRCCAISFGIINSHCRGRIQSVQ